jgi:RNA polymerase sigma-70 factor (ECF subfamily)
MSGRSSHEPGGDASDEESLVASRADPAQFAAFYDRRFTRVLAYFYRRILCPHTSAELAAETFARAFEVRHKFDPERGTAMGWLMGIALNLYRQWSYKGEVSSLVRERLRVETPTLFEDDLAEIESLIDLARLRGALRDALADLSDPLRDAVMLRVALDLPYPEVADRLGCSIGAARVRVSRGLESLFLHIETRDD